MTQTRKDQLYDLMIAWICEHASSDKDLFLVLTEQFGMTKEELHDHSIESLDRFFPDDKKTVKPVELPASESVQTAGMSLTDFIAKVSDMVKGDDKTAVLDWVSFAGFMASVSDQSSELLQRELRGIYLPLCYVKNNFSDDVLQKSLRVDMLGNEVICGAMLFSAGYSENEVRDMANEAVLEDGYIPLDANETGVLSVVAIADRNDCVFIANNVDEEITYRLLKRAAFISDLQGCDIVSALKSSETAGMPLRKITDARLVEAVKIACTDSTAFDHITVYDPETQEVRQRKTEGLTAEERDAFFCCGNVPPMDTAMQDNPSNGMSMM